MKTFLSKLKPKLEESTVAQVEQFTKPTDFNGFEGLKTAHKLSVHY